MLIFQFFCQIEFVFQPIFVEIPIAAVGIVVAVVKFVAVEVSTSPKFQTGYLDPREKKKFNRNQKLFFSNTKKKTLQNFAYLLE